MQRYVVVQSNLRALGYIAQEHNPDAYGAGFLLFNGMGVPGKDGRLGRDPVMIQRRFKELTVAAVHHQAVGSHLEYSAANEAAAFNTTISDLLGPDRLL
jgi:hypothetical protein